jgi:hypothetical protein
MDQRKRDQLYYSECIRGVLIFSDEKKDLFHDNEAFNILGIVGDEADSLVDFMREVLGRDEIRATAYCPRGRALLVLEGREDDMWRIIFLYIPPFGTQAIQGAVATLAATLKNEEWLREAVDDGDDIFWWDDSARKWNSDVVLHLM